MSFSVTQCPACESTFNITARILESAGGKVRCGACLTVFEAPDNIIEYGDDSHDSEDSVFVGNDPGNYFDPSTFLTRQSLQEAARESARSVTDEATLNTVDDAQDEATEVDFLEAVEAAVEEPETTLDDGSSNETETWLGPEATTPEEQPGDTAAQAVESNQEEEEDKEEETDSLESPVSDSPTSPSPWSPHSPFAHYGEKEPEPSPENFRLHVSFSMQASPPAPTPPPHSAQSLETDAADTDAAVENETTEREPSERATTEGSEQHTEPAAEEAFLEAVNEEFADHDADSELPQAALDWTLATSEDAVEEQEMIEELGEAAEDLESEQPADGDQSIEDIGEAEAEESATVEIDQSVEAIRARALQHQLEDDEALESLPSENLQALGKFSSPVEILAGKPRSLRRQLTWTAIALLGAIMLGGQYLWKEMDRFSQNARLRPVLATACQWMDCQLPVYTDIEAIRASNLAVRSHPEVDNALAVNIEFQNSAPFAQQFPVLILSFNAANNSVIALREFSAQEYLPEQLRNRRLMPAQTPIQIDLSIIDPGDDAVNYTLAFRSP